MAAVDAIIFDLGNVLAFHDNALLYRRLGERAGVGADVVERVVSGPPLFEAINRGALDGEGIHRELCRALGLDLDLEPFASLWSSHFSVNVEMQPLVAALAGRVRLLLLSNTNVLHTAYLRPLLPVLERFDHLLFSHDLGLIKPEPAFFQAALDRAGASPGRVAFFDDLPAYVRAARALGIRGYVFNEMSAFRRNLAELGLSATEPPAATPSVRS